MLEDAPGQTALVVEGGAMRSVFAAGVLHALSEQRAPAFDTCYGVSAGALVTAVFLSGRAHYAFDAFRELSDDREFIRVGRFLRGGDLIDLDWALSAIQRRGYLSTEDVARWPSRLVVGVTDVGRGSPLYVPAKSGNLLKLLKATAALPLLCRQFPLLDGRPVLDGGVSDPVPLAEALRAGARRVVVIRSRPHGYTRRDSWGHRYIRFGMRRHDALVRALQARVARHEQVQKLIQSPPVTAEILELCPPNSFELGRFGRDGSSLRRGYEAGRSMAAAAVQFLTRPTQLAQGE